jgi:hypothetical protein
MYLDEVSINQLSVMLWDVDLPTERYDEHPPVELSAVSDVFFEASNVHLGAQNRT